jgi:uncharacterized protein
VTIRLEPVLRAVRAEAPLADSVDHGELHWRTVAQLALELDDGSADRPLLVLFGLLHDARRVNEHHDPGHGARGGALARELCQKGLLELAPARLATLVDACERHTDGLTSTEPTVARCWDADRLHLPRVGVVPDPARFSTERARLEPPQLPTVPRTWEELFAGAAQLSSA